MKILYTCAYSAGISGVWNRVWNLASELRKKGHEVYVFSSNKIAGTNKMSKPYDNYQGIHIYRFPVKRKISENVMIWDFQALRKKLLEIMPDIIDCQTYRHPEGKIALSVAMQLRIPCFLTTHAPFVEKKVRGLRLSMLASLYDTFIGKKLLKNIKKARKELEMNKHFKRLENFLEAVVKFHTPRKSFLLY